MTEEKIKNLKEDLKLRLKLTEAELEEFIKKLIVESRVTHSKDFQKVYPQPRIWKKEEIEELGIEVKPVRWKKLT